MIGLGIFAMLTLAVVGTLIQTARLDQRDSGMTETAMLADSLMEERVSQARVYQGFVELVSTPPSEYWTLEEDRTDGLHQRYLYRVDVNEPSRGLKEVRLTIYHRDPDFPGAVVDETHGQDGLALRVGTVLAEPAR